MKGNTAVQFLKTVAMSAVILGCATLDFACVSSQSDTKFTYDGLQRTYQVYQSALYDGSEDFPLMLVLHGAGQTGEDMVSWTHMDTIADEMGFNVVYPDAYEGNWNDGRGVAGIAAYDQDVDDVGFLKALVERVATTLRVDSKRVYVAGMSNGAMMAYRLACEAPDFFASAAVVAGALPVSISGTCYPSVPIPLIAFNGTNDGIVSWDGGTIVMDGENLGEILSVPNTIARWVSNDLCNATPAIVQMPNTDTTDGVTAYRQTYTPHDGGADVVFYRLDGAGHTWPGGPSYQLVLGSICYDIDASDLIGAFCLEHTR